MSSIPCHYSFRTLSDVCRSLHFATLLTFLAAHEGVCMQLYSSTALNTDRVHPGRAYTWRGSPLLLPLHRPLLPPPLLRPPPRLLESPPPLLHLPAQPVRHQAALYSVIVALRMLSAEPALSASWLCLRAAAPCLYGSDCADLRH